VRLRYAPRARGDIVYIYQHIAQHNVNAAVAILRQIRATSQLLARYPGLGRETNVPEVRVFPISRYPYLIYHKVDENELTIIHVRDGRRDAPKERDL
jgi:plasmid stabilization system protein ParE